MTKIHGRASSPTPSQVEKPKPPPPPPPPRPAPERNARNVSAFEPARRPKLDLTGGTPPPASTLRNEVVGDGRANCLEKASRAARPGDQVLLYQDSKDPVGHAIVQRPDGSVVDPNEPARVYKNRAEWESSHTDYRNPVSVKQEDLSRVLNTPPGPARDALIGELGLSAIANRLVADSTVRDTAIRDLVERGWDNPYELEQMLSGQGQLGRLSDAERALVGQLVVEKGLSQDGGLRLAQLGEEISLYPNLARAVGKAYDAGTVTDAQLSQLLGPSGLGSNDTEYNGIASLAAASGSTKLQSAVATRIWDVAAAQPDRLSAYEYQVAALRATGGSPAATRALLDRAGPEALSAAVDNLADIGARAPLPPQDNRFFEAAGTLLKGLAGLPSSAASNAVGARVVSHLTQNQLANPKVQQGLFDYMRSARSDAGWRGLGPAGSTFTQLELLTKFPDPAIRNYMVTEQYSRLSHGMEELIPGQANWATYGTWASKQAGSAIRGELMGGLSSLDPGVAAAISHGNTLVATEIAPVFGAFIDTLKSNPSASFDDVWRAAGNPDKPLLREAFQNYYEAFQLQRSGGSSDAIAERMLTGNALVGQHEQTQLQADIDDSMGMDTALGRIPLAQVMASTMTLELPGRTLNLGQDLTGQYPPELATLSLERAQELARQYGGLTGTGTDNWPDLQQRMEYIFNLFRVTQQDPSRFNDWTR